MLRRKAVVYVTDRGIEYVLQEMKASHLLNTLVHISRQVTTLENLANGVKTPTYIINRIKALEESYAMLAEELATRDPAEDEEYEEKYCDEGGY